jgi:hypothetical protein
MGTAWTGKVLKVRGYGSVPWIKTRSIIPLADEMVSFIPGRDDVQSLEGSDRLLGR